MNIGSRPVCQHSIISSAAGGTLAIPGAGAAAFPTQRIAVFALSLSTGPSVNVTLQDTASNALSALFSFGATPLPLVLDMLASFEPRWITSANGIGIQLNASAAVQVGCDIWWLPVT